ncbi:hypothetical protein LTS08_002337 [Lithohypha guttulata]|nr:hypothetical protein LTS08_002337 [Lithohypha guttulata]
MAPDINSVVTVSQPVSLPAVAPARSSAARTTSISNTNPLSQSQHTSPGQSRRTSSAMGPPPLPVPNNSSLPNSPRPPHAAMERSPSSQGLAVGSSQGQGPIRHPRPLTAAELHLELEKEQESIVNRLTRELSALRAQTASVASTASSTSDLFTTSTSHDPFPYSSGTAGSAAYPIPTSARRHRSSSNLSTRSARSAREAVHNAGATSVSGVAAPRDPPTERSARQSLDIQRPDPGSRQNSYSYNHGLGLSTSTSSGNMYRSASNTTSPYAPAPPSGYTAGYYGRHSREPSQQSQLPLAGAGSRSPSFGSVQAAARYEEAAVQRQELESVKKENESLKQKIRELEKQLAGDATIRISETTAQRSGTNFSAS